MIGKKEFVEKIMSLEYGQYIDVFLDNESEEPDVIFTKRRLFASSVIVGKCVGDGSFFIAHDSLYEIPEDTLEGYYDSVSETWDNVRLEEPYTMQDWD